MDAGGEPTAPRVNRQELRRDTQTPKLFDYQRDLANEVQSVIEAGQSCLLALPTGGGKTRTAVVAVLDALRSGLVERVAWLAPSIELVDQAFETFHDVWREYGEAPDMILQRQDVPEADQHVVWCTTPQGVYRKAQTGEMLSRWDLVVFDEAHQMAARTFRLAVEALRRGDDTVPVVGLSATPGRALPDETQDLVELFDRKLLKSDRLRPNPVSQLQRRGVLAHIRFRSLPQPPEGLTQEAGRILIASKVVRHLVERNRRVLCFTATVPGALVLAECLEILGCRASAVHSNLSATQRIGAIEAFGSGVLEVLTNNKLLATGYDCPAVSDVVLLARVGSPILFEQMVGRGARGPKTGGSARSTVWDFDNHLALHGLPQSYYRFRDFDWR